MEQFELIENLFSLIFPVVLLALGYFIGRTVEKRHFRSLAVAESELSHIMVSDMKSLPPNWNPENGVLVMGSVVIATDYFKVFVGWVQNLLGGRIREFETLLERGRREAIVRMLREASKLGANVVWNVRIETSMMGDAQSRSAGGAEVFVYGTALRVR